jgi:hypothetical protein
VLHTTRVPQRYPAPTLCSRSNGHMLVDGIQVQLVRASQTLHGSRTLCALCTLFTPGAYCILHLLNTADCTYCTLHTALTAYCIYRTYTAHCIYCCYCILNSIILLLRLLHPVLLPCSPGVDQGDASIYAISRMTAHLCHGRRPFRSCVNPCAAATRPVHPALYSPVRSDDGG